MKKALKILVILTLLIILLPTQAFAATKTTMTANVNLRQKATTNSKVLIVVPKNTAISNLGKSGKFIKIKYKNKTGFVHSSYTKTVTVKTIAKPAVKPKPKPTPPKPIAKPKPKPVPPKPAPVFKPTPTPPASVVKTRNLDKIETEVFNAINSQRSKYKLPPLKNMKELNQSSYVKSKDMADKNYFDHVSPTGMDLVKLVEQYTGTNWTMMSENIAAGAYTSQVAMNGWMNSPGHKANILSKDAKYVGVGVYFVPNGQKTSYQTLWTTQFFSK